MSQCEQFRGQLADYVVGALKGRTRSHIEEHLRLCASCMAEVSALERTGEMLGAGGPFDAPEATWDAISRRIARPARGVVRRLRWVWGTAAGALAIAVILIAVLIFRPTGAGQTNIIMSPPAEEELNAAMDGNIAAAWDAPLSDEAAIGLRFASTENDG